ncbi:MAG: hypothetical protein AAF353_14960 [Pseudomonadota bacterium]
MRNLTQQFFSKGWCRFPFDKRLQKWVDSALSSARDTVLDERFSRYHRYQNTWFAGVNVLPNDETGAVPGGLPVSGSAVDFIRDQLGLTEFSWDRAQVSVCYPGYPKPMEGESEAKFRFRKDRDAAHIDGLLPVGEHRRRYLRETHGFILGIPMVEFDQNASPFVVWEKSHEVMRHYFETSLAEIPSNQWTDADLTEIYHKARKQIFETCDRVTIHAKPGEAFLAHRLVLHGTAPWKSQADAGADGRMICYFRPVALDTYGWLKKP